jgi:hypothetical protein
MRKEENTKLLNQNENRFMLNLNRLIDFSTKKTITPNTKIIYFAHSFDAISNINQTTLTSKCLRNAKKIPKTRI